MVVIRLTRTGAKKAPFYHVVVADRRRSRDGRFLERLGFYNPSARGNDVRIQINQERLAHWTSVGAQMSERVAFLAKAQTTGELAPLPSRAEVRKEQAKNAAVAAKKRLDDEKKAAEAAVKAEAEKPVEEASAEESNAE